MIDDSVLVKIATRVTSNIRELEGVFNKLKAYTSFTNSELTDDIIELFDIGYDSKFSLHSQKMPKKYWISVAKE